MRDNILPLINRTTSLFEKDIYVNEEYLRKTVRNSRFRVIGGAGTIGSAIFKEIFNFEPFKILKEFFFNNYSSVPVFKKK